MFNKIWHSLKEHRTLRGDQPADKIYREPDHYHRVLSIIPENLSLWTAVSLRSSSGETVVDIGANVGVFSVFLSKEVGETGRVFAFEPVRETFIRLHENLVLNLSDNVRPISKQLLISRNSG